MKSGNLNFLKPSEPLQACNGTALPYMSPTILINRVIEVSRNQIDEASELPFPRLIIFQEHRTIINEAGYVFK